MGDLLGIKGFNDHEELLKMTRELNAASRKDAKEQREAGYEGNQLRGTLIGKVNPNVPASEFAPKMRQWMKLMRERFAIHIIRRTIDSKDPRGQKLFGMRPYQDHSLHLRMYDWEMENLRSFAKEIVKDNPMAAAADTRKVRFRYITFAIRCSPSWTAGRAASSSLCAVSPLPALAVVDRPSTCAVLAVQDGGLGSTGSVINRSSTEANTFFSSAFLHRISSVNASPPSQPQVSRLLEEARVASALAAKQGEDHQARYPRSSRQTSSFRRWSRPPNDQ